MAGFNYENIRCLITQILVIYENKVIINFSFNILRLYEMQLSQSDTNLQSIEKEPLSFEINIPSVRADKLCYRRTYFPIGERTDD
jgi:hypothetical protein